MTRKSSDKGHIASHMRAQTPDESARQSLTKIKQKFLVMSGKGGTGKTSVSVNLAIALAAGATRSDYWTWICTAQISPICWGSAACCTQMIPKMVPIAYSDHLKIISMESLMHNRDEASYLERSCGTFCHPAV
ncbi:MAG: P-loop NTPase [Desulfotignum sp.]|nr:P-loop NTPase [Desulfotignum sp.]